MPRRPLAWCVLCCLAQQFLAHPSAAEELRSLIVELGLGAHEGDLRAESILTAQDLALLSADDMAGIGLTVGAKNRLLAWQRREQRQPSVAPPPPAPLATVSVLAFGADPRGQNDSTAAFNRAFQQAKALGFAASVKGAFARASVFVPGGTYANHLPHARQHRHRPPMFQSNGAAADLRPHVSGTSSAARSTPRTTRSWATAGAR